MYKREKIGHDRDFFFWNGERVEEQVFRKKGRPSKEKKNWRVLENNESLKPRNWNEDCLVLGNSK